MAEADTAEAGTSGVDTPGVSTSQVGTPAVGTSRVGISRVDTSGPVITLADVSVGTADAMAYTADICMAAHRGEPGTTRTIGGIIPTASVILTAITMLRAPTAIT